MNEDLWFFGAIIAGAVMIIFMCGMMSLSVERERHAVQICERCIDKFDVPECAPVCDLAK